MLRNTERCRIEPFTGTEGEELYALLSSPAVMAHLEPPYTRARSDAFLKACGLGKNPLIYGVWSRGSGCFLGYVIFHPREPGCWEIGWVLARRYWGLGLARELTGELIELAREMQIPQLVIPCAPSQKASQAVAEYFGFSPAPPEDGKLIYRLNL